MGLLQAEVKLKAQAEQAQLSRARGLQGECSLLERQLEEARDAAKRSDSRHQTQVSTPDMLRHWCLTKIGILTRW